MVDAIVEAAARILGQQGWTGFTTNKVAEAAGVSIGSYYQYFPDKHSLTDAILRRHLDDCLAVVRRATRSALTPAALATELVDGMIAVHSITPGLHRVLLDDAPDVRSARDPHSAFEAEFLGHYVAAVAACRGRAPTEADRIAGMLISDAIDGAIHNAARRGMLDVPAVRQGLIGMIAYYLESGPG
jgi:AcrR family transcriptional regulator